MKKILLIISFLLFLLPLLFIRHHLSIFYFQNDINRIAVNIEADNLKEPYICFDSECDLLKYQNGIYSYKLNQETPLFYNDISNIELILSNNTDLKSIKNITIFNGNKFEYIDSSKLNFKEIDFNNSKKISLDLPFSLNSKTVLQKLGVYIESIFYNWYFYVLGYILLIFCLIKYDFKKIKINHNIFLLLIILLGTILRFSHIDFIPLWNDELYTYTVISDSASGFNLKNIFYDPGNPPLFFLLSNIWLKFFHSSVTLIRLFPLLLGVFGIYFIYFVTNKILNKNVALVSSFLMSFNIFVINESNEIRSYILSMSLVLFGMYSFYLLNKEKTNKNFLIYFLSSFALINTHFYCFLFALYNFILGLILFKDSKIKFFFVNIGAFSTFLIYFLFTYKNSFSKTFNTWLASPDINVLYDHIIFYFGNIIWFIISLAFLCFIFKKLSKDEKKIVIYIVSSISFVFIFSYLFSLFVKPILFERYFCIFIPLLIIITSIFLCYEYKTKFKPLIILVILLFSFSAPKYENFNLFSNIHLLIKYSSVDSKYYSQEYDIYTIIPDNIKYTNYYKNEIKNINSKFIVSNNGILEDIDMLDEIIKKSDKKKVVIYLPEICTNQFVKQKYKVKKIFTSILPVYKIIVLK